MKSGIKIYLLLFSMPLLLLLLQSIIIPSYAAAEKKDIQEIKERLIRIEERMVTKEELKAEIKDVRAEIKDVRIEIKEFMLWGFGILFSGMGILIGFVIWDRRTALAPAIKKYKELEEKEELIEKALKEFAKTEPKLAEILKSMRLM